MIIEFNGIRPRIGTNVFIAPTATVIGDVEIQDNANIWYGTVLRGDRATIIIGRNTNIQDNCTVHTDAE
jgi:carbonic anhydrase/acetyltransferase-like protein (isoleucine patch superfamily)